MSLSSRVISSFTRSFLRLISASCESVEAGWANGISKLFFQSLMLSDQFVKVVFKAHSNLPVRSLKLKHARHESVTG